MSAQSFPGNAHRPALTQLGSPRLALVLALILPLVLSFILASGTAGAGVTVQERDAFAPYGPHRVHYRVLGSGPGTVVLVHGWCCDINAWKNQAPELAGRYRVVLVDMIGHGSSDKPRADYTIEYLAGSVNAVMGELGPGPKVLAGHSLGFPVIHRAAELEPRGVAGIFNLDGAMQFPPPAADPAVVAKWEAEQRAFQSGLMKPDREQGLQRFLAPMFVPATTPEIRETVFRTMLSTPAWVADSALNDFARADPWRWKPMLLPAFSLYAVSNHLPPEFPALMKERLPRGGYRTMDGVGHFLMLEKPEEVTAVMGEFLAQTLPGR